MNNTIIGRVALISTLITLSTVAQADIGKTTAYAEGVTATTVWKNSYGECWRTGTWTQEQATIEGCDGYVKPAPAIEPPAPVAPPAAIEPPVVAPAEAAPPAPEPVATPAPEPVVVAPVVAPPPPQTTRFVLKSDVLFDSGKSDLKEKGFKTLDALYEEIQNANPTRKIITVFGYADRSGNPANNRKLSESRAENVAKYLATKGIGDSIRSEGWGSNNPVTGRSCDKVARAKLAACLAPDRRVEIEVTGTAKK